MLATEQTLTANSTLEDEPTLEETYTNVMEKLVAEAIARRFAKLSPRQASYVNRVQVMTYALNRVPPLYASSEEGVTRQRKRARLQHAREIQQAVNQAFAAVQRDPLKTSTPLCSERDEVLVGAEQALTKIREAFQRDDLSWEEAANWVMNAVKRRGISEQEPGSIARANRQDATREAVARRLSARTYRPAPASDKTAVPFEREQPPISVWDRTHAR
ncbi:MAG: late competence development ComFB family protein [Geitlerinemataceae cyanobacterium]